MKMISATVEGSTHLVRVDTHEVSTMGHRGRRSERSRYSDYFLVKDGVLEFWLFGVSGEVEITIARLDVHLLY